MRLLPDPKPENDRRDRRVGDVPSSTEPTTSEPALPPPTGGSGGGLTPPARRGGSYRQLTDVVVELGFLTPAQVQAAVEEAKATSTRPEAVLAASGALTADQFARATAERFGLEHVDLTIYQPDLAAVNLLRPDAARRYSAVPIGFDPAGVLLVAMSDPSNIIALDDLKMITGHEARRVVASGEDLASLIARMNRLAEAVANVGAADEDDEPVIEEKESAEDGPVVKLVNQIIGQAIESGASDVHFEAEGREMRVRFRIDGVMSHTTTIPRRTVAGMVSRLKIMCGLDIAERRVPQDGRSSLRVNGNAVDIRAVTLPSSEGEGVVLRLLDSTKALLDLNTLGVPADGLERFQSAFEQSHGAVLVTGPTGSGKSTTLYAALNALNSVEKKILTIEDPVEYQLPMVNQMQVNTKAGLSFATGLRSMLRADPDIIMVGEIRDAETAKIAIESALTGHLVLSTLHTNDAPSALARLTEMGVEPFLSASAVDCVVAQRLARKLCVYCRIPVTLSADALWSSGFRLRADSDAVLGVEAFEPKGCARCSNSGYKGRIGLYEVLSMSEEIRSLTVERASADAIRTLAVEQGMRPLRDDGLEKVRAGLTSIAEVLRVS